MKYQLFSDLDQNFGIHFILDNDEMGEMVHEHPVTKKKMTRQEALELAESICNPSDPKTKQEFFSRFSDEDYANYVGAVSSVKSGLFKEYIVILTKFDIRPDFDLSDQDIKTLKAFCKEFNISALPHL